MTGIIESINNFGITIYNGEPYFDTIHKVSIYKNMSFKCKIHKEPYFNVEMKEMKLDYLINILNNEELLYDLTNKIEKKYVELFPNRLKHPSGLDSNLVNMYLIEIYYNELQKPAIEEPILEQNKKSKKEIKPKKKNITQLMKRRVWAKHIGEEIGKFKCLCCNMSDITQLTFNCGHIIAEANGGETIVENLLPICQSCNSSMGKRNLFDYKKEHGL
jgi:hypothetical protein